MLPNINSHFWIPSSLIYADLDSEMDSDFGNRFDPSLFDDIEEPPPVHILYPRPPSAESIGISINNHRLNALSFITIFLFICFRPS